MADEQDDDEGLPRYVEILGRAPIQILDDTTTENLADEMAQRLLALLDAHNGLKPTAEGWRQLALDLALQYEPAFKIETPVDRSSMGGRPIGFGNFSLRSRMKAEMRKGKNQAEAARTIARASKGAISFKTANNVFSRKSQAPDEMRLWRYKWKAENAIRLAAQKLSQE